MKCWSRDSADVGDGWAGISPVTYPTPFPDPPVSSPGMEIQQMPFSKSSFITNLLLNSPCGLIAKSSCAKPLFSF